MTGKISQKYVFLMLLGLSLVAGLLQQVTIIPLGNNEMVLLYAVSLLLVLVGLSFIKAIKSGKFSKEAYGQRKINFDIFEDQEEMTVYFEVNEVENNYERKQDC